MKLILALLIASSAIICISNAQQAAEPAIDPTEPGTNPAEPVEPVEPVEPIEPVEPAEPAEPVEPAEPGAEPGAEAGNGGNVQSSGSTVEKRPGQKIKGEKIVRKSDPIKLKFVVHQYQDKIIVESEDKNFNVELDPNSGVLKQGANGQETVVNIADQDGREIETKVGDGVLKTKSYVSKPVRFSPKRPGSSKYSVSPPVYRLPVASEVRRPLYSSQRAAYSAQPSYSPPSYKSTTTHHQGSDSGSNSKECCDDWIPILPNGQRIYPSGKTSSYSSSKPSYGATHSSDVDLRSIKTAVNEELAKEETAGDAAPAVEAEAEKEEDSSSSSESDETGGILSTYKPYRSKSSYKPKKRPYRKHRPVYRKKPVYVHKVPQPVVVNVFKKVKEYARPAVAAAPAYEITNLQVQDTVTPEAVAGNIEVASDSVSAEKSVENVYPSSLWGPNAAPQVKAPEASIESVEVARPAYRETVEYTQQAIPEINLRIKPYAVNRPAPGYNYNAPAAVQYQVQEAPRQKDESVEVTAYPPPPRQEYPRYVVEYNQQRPAKSNYVAGPQSFVSTTWGGNWGKQAKSVEVSHSREQYHETVEIAQPVEYTQSRPVEASYQTANLGGQWIKQDQSVEVTQTREESVEVAHQPATVEYQTRPVQSNYDTVSTWGGQWGKQQGSVEVTQAQQEESVEVAHQPAAVEYHSRPVQSNYETVSTWGGQWGKQQGSVEVSGNRGEYGVQTVGVTQPASHVQDSYGSVTWGGNSGKSERVVEYEVQAAEPAPSESEEASHGHYQETVEVNTNQGDYGVDKVHVDYQPQTVEVVKSSSGAGNYKIQEDIVYQPQVHVSRGAYRPKKLKAVYKKRVPALRNHQYQQGSSYVAFESPGFAALAGGAGEYPRPEVYENRHRYEARPNRYEQPHQEIVVEEPSSHYTPPRSYGGRGHRQLASGSGEATVWGGQSESYVNSWKAPKW